MITDQIVFGINNSKLREQMLHEKGLTLLKTEEICKVPETMAQQSQVWNKVNDHVDAVSRHAASPALRVRKACQKEVTLRTTAKQQRSGKCYWRHKARQCPANNKKCNSFRKFNHFAICCPGEAFVSKVSKNSSGGDFHVLDVGIKSGNSKDWMVKVNVAEREVIFKVDTGSQASLLPFSVYKKLRTRGKVEAYKLWNYISESDSRK